MVLSFNLTKEKNFLFNITSNQLIRFSQLANFSQIKSSKKSIILINKILSKLESNFQIKSNVYFLIKFGLTNWLELTQVGSSQLKSAQVSSS